MIDYEKYPWVKQIESRWKFIRNEYRLVEDQFSNNDLERLNPEDKWHIFPIISWPDLQLRPEARMVPTTFQSIRSFVPEYRAATFSRLSPNSYIPPHRGHPDGDWLRLHLGLHIPQGDVGIKVDGETLRWEEGKALILDDQLEHEAWNKTNYDRIVLIVDFKR